MKLVATYNAYSQSYSKYPAIYAQELFPVVTLSSGLIEGDAVEGFEVNQ